MIEREFQDAEANAGLDQEQLYAGRGPSFILDTLYQAMPQPPFTGDDIEEASERVYNFIWAKSANDYQASARA